MQTFDLQIDANAESVPFTITPHATGQQPVQFSYPDNVGATNYVDITEETRNLFGLIRTSQQQCIIARVVSCCAVSECVCVCVRARRERGREVEREEPMVVCRVAYHCTSLL